MPQVALAPVWLPMIVSIFALGLNLGCNWLFVFVMHWGHQSLALTTSITATVETVSHNGTDETTVTLTATQVLSAAGTAYQSVPITLTRILQRDPAGHWGIGRPVTAS